MTVFLDDGDVRLYVGDSLDVLRTLPDESVDCCVTSPPYWGLRDYGTGRWDGGDPACDHSRQSPASRASSGLGGSSDTQGGSIAWGSSCGRCGARRVDDQIGLEDTPDAYVRRLVDVFREVRRVLAPHGTLWLNLGDSYFGTGRGPSDEGRGQGFHAAVTGASGFPTRGVYTHDTLKPKDLVGVPWRVAFALQADGWWLRADIIWAKPNPMPESVTDRPTKAHEYVFLLSKRDRYWYDADAIREADGGKPSGNSERRANPAAALGRGDTGHAIPWSPDGTGRNARSVWTIATRPYAGAHFAVFPSELARRAITAGCPEKVCRTCGHPSERIVDVTKATSGRAPGSTWQSREQRRFVRGGAFTGRTSDTVGWSDCGHDTWRSGVVLDPFAGSGTTLHVARHHARHAIGIELNPDFAALAGDRLQQLSLLGGAA